jgi:hypothetical protein
LEGNVIVGVVFFVVDGGELASIRTVGPEGSVRVGV